MASYGAPLYRVESRVWAAATSLDIPVSTFVLPQTIMMNVGNGDSRHLSRTSFMRIPQSFHMWKLYQVDRLARRISVTDFKKAKKMLTAKTAMTSTVVEESPLSLATELQSGHQQAGLTRDASSDADGFTNQKLDTVEHNSANGNSTENLANDHVLEQSTPESMSHARTDSQVNGAVEIDIDLGEGTAQKLAQSTPPALRRRVSRATSIIDRSDEEPVEFEEFENELFDIEKSNDSYSDTVRLLCGAIQSSSLAILMFKGSLADGLAATILGAFATKQQMLADKIGAKNAVVMIFVSSNVSFISRLAQSKYIWSGMPGSPEGLCHDIVALSSLVNYLPGIPFALSMLELGSEHNAAAAVRMFQAFMKSMLMGYGIMFGTRMATSVLKLMAADEYVELDVTKSCPVANLPFSIDWWRMPFFVPMTMTILVFLKADKRQWISMSLSSLVAFLTSNIARIFLPPDLTAAISSFSLGVFSNAWARWNDDIAIASVLAGIFWLVPGSIGVRGAIAAFTQDPSAVSGSGGVGTQFGIEVILRSLSIAVGLL
eukprot:jgi/Hompol1/978/HPOL_001178-RA